MQRSLTEAGQRALNRAARLARLADSRVVEPVHLLWALILEESRATERLERHGLTPSTIAPELPDGDDASVSTDPLAHSVSMTGVIAEACMQSNPRTSDGEITTEHLLWGLTAVATPAADFLAAHGLNRDAFTSHDDTDLPAEPLPVDFEIDWQSPAEAEGLNTARPPIGGERLATQSPGVEGAESFATLRILDAAANRAREGLRVAEDYTRFQLDDAHLTRLLKECRHDLAAAIESLQIAGFAMRDTPGDVGTVITTPAESIRSSAHDVARANLKRAQEAVRSLEEFGKSVSSEFAGRCEALRYRIYTLEKAVLTTAGSRERLADCRIYVLLTRDLCRRDPETVVEQAVQGGADVLQIREKSMPDRELVAWVRRVRELTRSVGGGGSDVDAPETATSGPRCALTPPLGGGHPLLIVNDRPDIAVLCDADGVHVGQEELTVADARRIVGPNRLVGVSTHTIAQARQAVLDGADYIGVGPVFPSQTKSFRAFAGLDFVRDVAGEIGLPWFAIGGIHADNVDQVVQTGATRIAVSGAICGGADAGDAASALRAGLLAPR